MVLVEDTAETREETSKNTYRVYFSRVGYLPFFFTWKGANLLSERAITHSSNYWKWQKPQINLLVDDTVF